MATRIVLADDCPVLLDGLQSVLRQQADLVVLGRAYNGRDAVHLVEAVCPNVAVLGVALPDLNGIGATLRIRENCPQTRVLAIGMQHSDRTVQKLIQAGAKGFCSAHAPVERIVSAIRDVASGKLHLEGHLMDYAQAEDCDGSPLTDREREVLQLVAEGKSSKEIAAQLFITTKTIEWHRKSIMDKLDLRSIAALTKYAIREGITSIDN